MKVSIKTSLFLRKGENPSKRPTWRQSEIDDTIRYRKAGYAVEPQVSFLNGQRCKNGISDSIRVDNYVEGLAAVEIKNYNLTTNSSGLVSNIVEQAIKHQKHLPEGTRQIFKIDARGQVLSKATENNIRSRIVSKTGDILKAEDVRFIKDKK